MLENKRIRQYSVMLALLIVILMLAWSFWAHERWTQLCAGLALFLFGMQCLEEGLRNLAGDQLEETISRSTSTPLKSFMIGLVGTTIMQSTTLVSLMTIAFISTGLLGLTAGIAIIIGTNLGATTGIWLLAFAGQNFSLSPLALPLIVFGVLASFCGSHARAAGRILLGIAFIFLGIDQIKQGFSSITENLDLMQYQESGIWKYLIFSSIGLVLTLILQSTHATLMLTLTALSLGQVGLVQASSIAIGANVGSSITTGLAGALGGNRSGQKLALAHVLFNVVTALLSLLLIDPLIWLTRESAALIGFADNNLIMLAIFHTAFNGLGAMIFWPLQGRLADWLENILPEKKEPKILIPAFIAGNAAPEEQMRARYLNSQALQSFDTASSAVMRELSHLSRLSIEVICHALYVPVSILDKRPSEVSLILQGPTDDCLDADVLYKRYIKGVYSDLLEFMSRIEMPSDDEQRAFWLACQFASMQLVEVVKDVKHLQKNLRLYLKGPHSSARKAYLDLRQHILTVLYGIREAARFNVNDPLWNVHLNDLEKQQKTFEAQFRHQAFLSLREGSLDSLQLSSLLNDLGYVGRIGRGLRTLLLLRHEEGIIAVLQNLDISSEHEPLISII